MTIRQQRKLKQRRNPKREVQPKAKGNILKLALTPLSFKYDMKI